MDLFFNSRGKEKEFIDLLSSNEYKFYNDRLGFTDGIKTNIIKELTYQLIKTKDKRVYSYSYNIESFVEIENNLKTIQELRLKLDYCNKLGI